MQRRVSLSLVAAVSLGVLMVVWGISGEAEGPICVPGFLSAAESNSEEVYDPTIVGTGLTITPMCSQLAEPRLQATVEPSLQTIMLTWNNLSDTNYYWGYVCDGDNVSIANNCSALVPNGAVSGDWTTSARGSSDPQPLSLGDTCHFFGCYVYVVDRFLGPTFHSTYYIENFNDTSCVIDKDECSDGSAQCEHECVDLKTGTSNSYQCMCKPGFSLSQDQHSCTDVDECVSGAHNCNHICTANDDGWYKCSCRDGYTLNQDGYTCNDINECLSNGTALCDTEVTGRNCTNTPGDYQCQCVEGYHFNEDQQICEDIDECAMNSSLCQHHCVNTDRGYNCTCGMWYVLVGLGNCSEVDVCTELAVDCGGHSQCLNSPETEEGYRCVCVSGYERNNNSCTLTGIVHVYWVVSLLMVLMILLLLGCVYLLRHKYMQNRSNKEKQYSVLFKYQMKKEEVDPSYNPVGFNPMRKVSYTFSLVSSFETYEYPLHPVIHEPDDSPDLEACFNSKVESPRNGYLLSPTDYDRLKRELSAITEANEDGISVGRDAEEHDTIVCETETEVSRPSNSRREEQSRSLSGPCNRKHEGVGKVTNDKTYFKESDIPPSPSVGRSSSTKHGVDSRTSEVDIEKEEESSQEKVCTEQTSADNYVQLSDFPGMLDANINEYSMDGPPADSGISVGVLPLTHPHHTVLMHSTMQPHTADSSDGYTHSSGSTTSSGYVSEMAASSSPKSRFLSTSSHFTDSSTAPSGSYVPSHLSTASSGYASESCVSVDKRGSLVSQLSCDTPRMPHFGSGWANGDYVTDTSLCGSPLSLTRKLKTSALNDSVFNDEECNPHTRNTSSITQGSINPVTSCDCHQIHEHPEVSVTSPVTAGTTSGYVNDEMCSHHNRDTRLSSITQVSIRPTTASDGHTVTSTGYIPYPGQDEEDTATSRDDITLNCDVNTTSDEELNPLTPRTDNRAMSLPSHVSNGSTTSVTVVTGKDCKSNLSLLDPQSRNDDKRSSTCRDDDKSSSTCRDDDKASSTCRDDDKPSSTCRDDDKPSSSSSDSQLYTNSDKTPVRGELWAEGSLLSGVGTSGEGGGTRSGYIESSQIVSLSNVVSLS